MTIIEQLKAQIVEKQANAAFWSKVAEDHATYGSEANHFAVNAQRNSALNAAEALEGLRTLNVLVAYQS